MASFKETQRSACVLAAFADPGVIAEALYEVYSQSPKDGTDEAAVAFQLAHLYLDNPEGFRKLAAEELGKHKSRARARASRENGKLGGRPRSA